MKEMNFTQGIKALCLVLLAVAGLSSCDLFEDKHETIELPFYEIKLRVGPPAATTGMSNDRFSGTDILAEDIEFYFYGSEEDYVFKENALNIPYEIVSEDSYNFYVYPSDTMPLWIFAKAGELTSTRFSTKEHFGFTHPNILNEGLANSAGYTLMERTIDNYGTLGTLYTSTCDIILSREPAALQLQVVHNGAPTSDAEVQLYLSEEAYLANKPAQEEYEELNISYGYLGSRTDLIDSYSEERKQYFNQLTDTEGRVMFKQLEPRRYWFRVTKDGLTNDAGTITIEEPLSSTSEATRSITVGIN